MTYARSQFELDRPIGDTGTTLRSSLVQVLESAGILDPRLGDPPPLPSALEYLWNWFQELASGRSGNGFGPDPLSWQEVLSWARLTGRRVSPAEVLVLKQLDLLWLTVHMEGKRG
jgi:hypothetical protein